MLTYYQWYSARQMYHEQNCNKYNSPDDDTSLYIRIYSRGSRNMLGIYVTYIFYAQLNLAISISKREDNVGKFIFIFPFFIFIKKRPFHFCEGILCASLSLVHMQNSLWRPARVADVSYVSSKISRNVYSFTF